MATPQNSARIGGLPIFNVIILVSNVVRLIERIFAQSPKSGPRKRARAMRALTRVLAPRFNGAVPQPVLEFLGILVDVLGKHAGKEDVIQQVVRVFDNVFDAVDLLRGVIEDDAETKAAVVDLINDTVDIPVVDEQMEALFISMLVDAVLDHLETAEPPTAIPPTAQAPDSF